MRLGVCVGPRAVSAMFLISSLSRSAPPRPTRNRLPPGSYTAARRHGGALASRRAPFADSRLFSSFRQGRRGRRAGSMPPCNKARSTRSWLTASRVTDLSTVKTLPWFPREIPLETNVKWHRHPGWPLPAGRFIGAYTDAPLLPAQCLDFL